MTAEETEITQNSLTQESGTVNNNTNVNNDSAVGGVSHEITLFAEPIFNIGGFTVTNSLLTSWSVVLIIILFSLVIRKKIKKIPSGLQNGLEIIVEGAMKLADSVTNDRRKTEKVFPFVFAIFAFILLNNWLGLLPGIGSVGFIEAGHEGSVFIPLFRGGTADMNTTLALALFAIVASNIFGILLVGAWNHINKFINIKALIQVPLKIKKEPSIVIVNPIKFFVGIVEIIGEVAKVASLSFRLFGNIFAGEVLLSSMALIFAFVVPIPFIFLEIIVGIIQALIFAMLTLVYFTIASTNHEEEH